jgi:hypothetical protein
MEKYHIQRTHPLSSFVAAYAIQFTFCAAFFWLNIMCFDICWMFKWVIASVELMEDSGFTLIIPFSNVRTISGSNAERERKKMIIYSLYAWTCPLVLLAIVIVVEFVPNLPEAIPKPNFGAVTCWYNTTYGTNLLFLCVGFLVCNFFLFFNRQSSCVYLFLRAHQHAALVQLCSLHRDSREDYKDQKRNRRFD